MANDKYINEPYFINDRSASTSFQCLGLTLESIRGLEPGTIVMEGGSGISLRLLRTIHRLNPELELVAVDPTYSFDPDAGDIRYDLKKDDGRELSSVRQLEAIHYGIQLNGRTYAHGAVSGPQSIAFQQMREDFHNQVAPYITLETDKIPGKQIRAKYRNQVGLYLDLFGAQYYELASSPSIIYGDSPVIDYFRYIYTLLKVGGKAIFYPAHVTVGSLARVTSLRFGDESYFGEVAQAITASFAKHGLGFKAVVDSAEEVGFGNDLVLELQKVYPFEVES